MINNVVYRAIRTPDGTILESRSRHDYKTYTDANGKEYMIDGGLDYLRCNAHDDQEVIEVTTDDPHEKVREVVTWGTYGKNGDQPLHYKKLKDMETGHIQACLETQNMYPGYKIAFKNELEYRNE